MLCAAGDGDGGGDGLSSSEVEGAHRVVEAADADSAHSGVETEPDILEEEDETVGGFVGRCGGPRRQSEERYIVVEREMGRGGRR